MIQKLRLTIFIIPFLLPISKAFAKEIPVQARLTLGSTSIDSDQINTFTTNQSLQKMDLLNQFSIEITYPLFKYLEVGAKYSKKLADSHEDPDLPGSTHSLSLKQDAYLLVARVPVIKKNIYRLDLFAGVGGTNTNLKVKAPGVEGELTKGVGNSWYSSPYGAAGVSLALGYKNFFVVFEGGVETNKVKDFKRSGNPGNFIDEVDLSGSYFTLGILLDGIPGTIGK